MYHAMLAMTRTPKFEFFNKEDFQYAAKHTKCPLEVIHKANTIGTIHQLIIVPGGIFGRVELDKEGQDLIDEGYILRPDIVYVCGRGFTFKNVIRLGKV